MSNITIEITGLKTLSTFIGLEDTPLYYDNGKFFKVENNKLVYTDIQWKDITGDISDQPELQSLIEKSVEEYSKDFVTQSIDLHNTNVEAHPAIQSLISSNYEELDYKINQNTESINTLDEKVDGINSNLTQKIEEVELDVTNKYNDLIQDIDELSGTVQENYNTLDSKIDTAKSDLQSNIDTLSNTVQENYNTLDSKIDTTKTDLQNNIDTLSNTVQEHYTDLTQDINDLVDTVNDNYTNLDTKITNTNTRITEVAEEINQTIEENVTSLQQADTNLQSQITTNKNDISELTQVVQDDYNELDTAIKAEETRAKGVENSLQQQLTSEVTNRENADNSLQAQIDAITSSSDVKDIVGTYAELQNYDKSTLGNNDIIKVLKDETKENASTYYKFSSSTQDFTYIGSEGPYYTKSDADNKFVPNTRTINNKSLSTNVNLNISDITTFTNSNSIDFTTNETSVTANINISSNDGNIISVENNGLFAQHQDISTLATKAELNDGLSSKQDTLTAENAGEGISIENGVISNTRVSAEWGNITGEISSQTDLIDKFNAKQDTLTAGRNITIQDNVISASDASTVEVDNETIEYTEDNKLSSIGSKLQSGGHQKYWQGTKTEFEAIVEKDENTLYQVLDDIVDIVTEIPTATVNDIGLVKPDGTSIIIDDTGTISISPNAKADTNLSNVTGGYDWVTTRVTYGNGESGYERTRLGWMYQWGKATSNANGEVEFTLHQPFKDVTYSIFAQTAELGNFFVSCYPSTNQKFKLRIQSSNASNMAVKFMWFAKGKAN